MFLFDPSVQLKLDGIPIRAALEEQVGAALYKRLDRAAKRNTVTTALAGEFLDALSDTDNPVLATLRSACAGDPEAAAVMSAMGPWETFYAGFTDPPGYCRRYRIALERACRQPTEALRRGEFGVAVAQLLDEPLANTLLWREAVEALDGATAIQQLLPLQFAGAMEAELSSLAAFDVQIQQEEGREASLFSVLLPEEGSSLNPAALFFRWVMRGVGAASMSELVDDLQRSGRPIHLVSLKNWHRGARMPSVSWLKLIISLKPELARGYEIGTLYWAAKLLMLLAYYGTLCATRSSSAIHEYPELPEIRTRLRPWPAFPHAYVDFGEWARARYPTWLAYHSARIETSPTYFFPPAGGGGGVRPGRVGALSRPTPDGIPGFMLGLPPGPFPG
ncbi:hypothetical protein [Caballeronia arationis]|uniref:hypothetical protein n=1 Tax=Caballeronia arationis TaxID=1777142 RepID=UPI0007875CCD|nr:hypothetical protein [Caballeronia arationis]